MISASKGHAKISKNPTRYNGCPAKALCNFNALEKYIAPRVTNFRTERVSVTTHKAFWRMCNSIKWTPSPAAASPRSRAAYTMTLAIDRDRQGPRRALACSPTEVPNENMNFYWGERHSWAMTGTKLDIYRVKLGNAGGRS